MVDRSTFLDLEMTTDVLVGQFANIFMVIINLFVFFIISLAVRNLGKDSLLKKLIYQPKMEIFYGQWISLTLPITVPFVFFIKGGVNNFTSKINLFIQYMLLLLNLSFSTGYFSILYAA